MKLAIGCPVFEREWCFDSWTISAAAQSFGMPVEYHFVYTPGNDNTGDLIGRYFPSARVIEVPGRGYGNAERADHTRYEHLAKLRNLLRNSVLASGADYFLSWDSDMVFEPVLHNLFIDRPVVGTFVEMLGQDWMLDNNPQAAFASWMVLDLTTRRADRPQEVVMPGDDPRRVGVVMGTVLWRRDALMRVRYEYHPQGEDIGIALRCADAGIEQWLVPAARGVHLHEGPGDRVSCP